MDPDPPASAPRKVRFAPKAPPARRTPVARAVTEDEDGEAAGRNVSPKVQELLNRKILKKENKCNSNTAQVSFPLGVESNTIRTFGKGKEKIEDTSDEVKLHEIGEDMQMLSTYVSTTGKGVDEISPGFTDNALTVKKKKKKKKGEYKEPWKLTDNYPVELPLRMPNTGNPELLDAAEFTDAPVYDENSVSSALELGLLDQDDNGPQFLFLQLPNLPFGSSRPSSVSTGKEIAGSSTNQKHGENGSCSLEELPAGQMGKLLVYKSGVVKWKIGDILYDVSPGVQCQFSQNLMAIDTTNKQCCNLGKLNTRGVVTPDIDSLLDNVDSITDLG